MQDLNDLYYFVQIVDHGGFAPAARAIGLQKSKLSRRLGEKWPVPVEVLPFGLESTRCWLERHGRVNLRERAGRPFVTDSGNFIFDVRAGSLEDPRALDGALRAIPGVVETGLFIARADIVVVAGSDGVRQLHAARSHAT